MYFWDLDHGFAGVVLIKKVGEKIREFSKILTFLERRRREEHSGLLGLDPRARGQWEGWYTVDYSNLEDFSCLLSLEMIDSFPDHSIVHDFSKLVILKTFLLLSIFFVLSHSNLDTYYLFVKCDIFFLNSRSFGSCFFINLIFFLNFNTFQNTRQAHYKLTSTIMLWLQTNKPGSGIMNLGGSLTRQVQILLFSFLN